MVRKTVHFPNLIDTESALFVYEYLRDTIKWEEGIRSKSGFTRKAKALALDDDDIVQNIVLFALQEMKLNQNYIIDGVYLNFYENGAMYTPTHSHKGTHQLIISLGATRTLTVGAKKYSLENGDIIIFGGSPHGIPKEPDIKEGRISIATFMTPI